MDQPARILIVEDEHHTAWSLQKILIHLGYHVTAVVASGEEAIARVELAEPDLVLMDIRLKGGLDGIETGAYLHTHTRVPLIYMTALKDDELVERMKATEPYGYVVKPFQVHELQAAIELALYKHRLAENLRETNLRLEQEIAARREKEQLVRQLNERLVSQNETLRASEARFHRMADNIQDGLVIIENGRLTYLNDRACAILGYARDEAARMSPADFFAPSQAPLTAPVASGYVGAISEENEVWLTPTGGARRCVYYHHTADYQESGTVKHYIALTDITERKQIEERLRDASFHDALTGLYNRAFFEEEVSRLEHSRQHLASVIIADLDGLKHVNDLQGHRLGDELLRRAAAVLRRSFRAEDVVARIGGDEFGVLLPETGAAEADAKLDSIRDALREHNQASADLPVHLSLGAATANFHDLSLAEAIRLADDRMYRDKSARYNAR